MEKIDIERLIAKKSDRISFKSHSDRSDAWKSFVKISIDDEPCDYVKCVQCSSVLKHVAGHGTGSMLGHIKACKNRAAKKPNTISTMPGFVAEPVRRTLSVANKSDFTDCLAYMCAKDIR